MYHATKVQSDDPQSLKSSEQRRHAPGVDGNSLEELLDLRTTACKAKKYRGRQSADAIRAQHINKIDPSLPATNWHVWEQVRNDACPIKQGPEAKE
jgi:hypothetical protein